MSQSRVKSLGSTVILSRIVCATDTSSLGCLDNDVHIYQHWLNATEQQQLQLNQATAQLQLSSKLDKFCLSITIICGLIAN